MKHEWPELFKGCDMLLAAVAAPRAALTLTGRDVLQLAATITLALVIPFAAWITARTFELDGSLSTLQEQRVLDRESRTREIRLLRIEAMHQRRLLEQILQQVNR